MIRFVKEQRTKMFFRMQFINFLATRHLNSVFVKQILSYGPIYVFIKTNTVDIKIQIQSLFHQLVSIRYK
jgi:hypothetical protein